MIRFRWPKLKNLKVLCAGSLILFSVFIYFLSDDSRVLSMSVKGNYYYTPQQIYRIADLSTHSRVLLEPPSAIEHRLEQDPLIEKAEVSVSGQSVSIQIEEKLIVGYYLRDGQNYVLVSSGNSIPIENPEYMKNLIHVPLLADLSDETMKLICQQFQDYPDYLTREVLEKIAEILPWSESYDDNMLKMIMQDGNLVFTSISSLQMIANYQLVLTELVGENVCLILDSDNGTIDKISCDYFNMSAEERDAYREELRAQAEQARKEAEEREKEEKENQNEDSSEEEDSQDQDNSEDIQDEEQPDGDQTDADQDASDPEQDSDSAQDQNGDDALLEASRQAQDWQPSDGWDWLMYSPSVNTYKSVNDDIYYVYDESIASFRALQ